MLNEVIEFHKVFGHPINQELNSSQIELRFNLIKEEFTEAAEELATLAMQSDHNATDEGKIRTKVRLTKELADMLYVIYGTAVALGLPLEEAYKEVHRSNMSKLGPNGEVLRREDGKVLKGPNYEEANIEQFFSKTVESVEA